MSIENGESIFGTREGMDLLTPNGRAQRIFDDMVHTSSRFGGIPVSFTSKESSTTLDTPQPGLEKPRKGNGIKPNRLRQQDNQDGLTGFWRGHYYVKGRRRDLK